MFEGDVFFLNYLIFFALGKANLYHRSSNSDEIERILGIAICHVIARRASFEALDALESKTRKIKRAVKSQPFAGYV